MHQNRGGGGGGGGGHWRVLSLPRDFKVGGGGGGGGSICTPLHTFCVTQYFLRDVTKLPKV